MVRKGLWIAVITSIVTVGSFSATARAAADVLQPGAAAPNFTLPSQEDKPISLSDFKGKWVVLYFYPKDQTHGCTIEAHNFEHDLPKFHALNAVVLGVSLGTVADQAAWCAKDTFNFKMLADPGHKVVDGYGVPISSHGEMQFAKRVTFLISPKGKIVKVWPEVDPNVSSSEVLSELTSIKK